MSAMDEMQVGAGTPGFELPRLGDGWRKPLLPPNHEFHRPSVRPRAGRGPFVIGLSGAAGSGKNTVAEHLVAKYGKNCGVVAMALADSLKEEVYDWLEGAEALFAAGLKMDVPGGVWPFFKAERSSAQKIEWINENKNHLRSVLQAWGTEYRRAQDADYWVDRLLERIAEDSPQVVLLTDVRFDNEIAICHANVKVEMVGQREDPGVAAHVSEREWREYDFGPNIIRAAKGDLGTLKRESERVFENILMRFHVQ